MTPYPLRYPLHVDLCHDGGMPEPDPVSTWPLDGVRIVDLTAVVMGPVGTRMLADFGADVIHIEPPGGGVIRHYDPMRSEAMSAFSMSVNRNKRSIVLDLKTTEGIEAVLDLVRIADVFVTSMRRSALDRLGLSYAELCVIKPDIIYCIANGFGSAMDPTPIIRPTTMSYRPRRALRRCSSEQRASRC